MVSNWEPALEEDHRVATQVMRGIRKLLPTLVRSISDGRSDNSPIRTRLEVPGYSDIVEIDLAVRTMDRRTNGVRECLQIDCAGTLQLGADRYPVHAIIDIDRDTNAILELRLRQPVET